MQQPTWAERDASVEKLKHLLLEHVGRNIERWEDLVGIISGLSQHARQRALTLLRQRTNEMRGDPTSIGLWRALRTELNRHYSHPDAPWAMPASDLEPLKAAYRELTPDDPVAAYGWLFDGYPDLPEGNAYQATEDDNSIEVARQSAIRGAYEIGGVSAVLAIAETATRPVAVGKAFADTFETEPALTLALEHLESDNRNRREMVCSILWELYQRLGWPVLDNTIAHLKATNGGPKAVASVYLVPLPEHATWERLSAEAQDVQRCYWAETNPWRVPEAEETSQFVAEQLLAVRRSATVAQWVAHLPIDYEIVIRTLEQLPIDLTTETLRRGIGASLPTALLNSWKNWTSPTPWATT